MNMNKALLSIIEDAKLTLETGWCRMYSTRNRRGSGYPRYAVDKNWRVVHPVIDHSAVRWTVEGALFLAIDRHSLLLLDNRERVERILRETIIPRANRVMGIKGRFSYWHDHPRRTVDDILRYLDVAAEVVTEWPKEIGCG